MAHYSCWTDGQIKGDISVCATGLCRLPQLRLHGLGDCLNVLLITHPDKNVHAFCLKYIFFPYLTASLTFLLLRTFKGR